MSRLPKPIVILSTGTLLLLASVIFGWVLVPKFIADQITQKVKLHNGSEVFEKWLIPPVPIFFKVYLFNVTNPQQVAEGVEFPKLDEIGPFCYREQREKIEVTENANGTIFYKEKVTYYFDDEKSSFGEDTELTILNIPYVAMAQKVSELLYPLNTLGLGYITKFKQKPFITKTAREILFQGWHLHMVAQLSEMLEMELIPNNTFGLFYGKNGTDDGFLEVDAGLSDVNMFGKILSWRGQDKLKWWKEGSNCNELKGTDGSIFPPFVTKNRIINIFNADLCRSLYLTFEKEVDFLGIAGYRFTAPKEMLEDPRTNEKNQCYCNELENCPHTGAMDLSPCRDGAPIAMSTPHFLNGFEEYQRKSGLQPDEDKHATILDIEPTTGIVLHAHKRIQVNVITKPVQDIRSLREMPDMLFPIVWADETAEIDEDLVQQLKSQLITPLITVEITKWTIFSISLFLIASACIRCWLVESKSKPEQHTTNGFENIKMLNGDVALEECTSKSPTGRNSKKIQLL